MEIQDLRPPTANILWVPEDVLVYKIFSMLEDAGLRHAKKSITRTRGNIK